MPRKRKNRAQLKSETSNLLKITVDKSAVLTGFDPKSKRIYVTVNAFAFSFNQVDSLFAELESLLKRYHQCQARCTVIHPRQVSIDMGCPDRNTIVRIAWDIVDWLERARKIFGAVSGVPTKDRVYKSIMATLKPAKDFRNILQHYDADVLKIALADQVPIMGSVIARFKTVDSWMGRVILSAPARFAGDDAIGIYGVGFAENAMRDDVDGITLSVADRTIPLSEIILKLRADQVSLANYLKERYDYEWPNS